MECPTFFYQKIKVLKKKLFSFLVQNKKQEEPLKKKKNVSYSKKIPGRSRKKIQVFFRRKIQKQNKKNFQNFIKKQSFLLKSLQARLKNLKKKEKKQIRFFLKKRLLWLKKRVYACFSRKRWRQYFQRFRVYRYFYKHYTEARLYEFLGIGRTSPGEMIRLASFPVKPTHFEFCYRRCEGVLLCSPQKWYALSLLEPTRL